MHRLRFFGKCNSDVFGRESLAGKTSNCSQVASHSRSVFQTERSKEIAHRLRYLGKRNSDVFGGEPLAGKRSDCSQGPSLPRLGKPSDYEPSAEGNRAQAEILRQTELGRFRRRAISRETSNCSRVASHSRSVFQTERSKDTVHRLRNLGKCNHAGLQRASLAGKTSNCSQVASLLGLESRATMNRAPKEIAHRLRYLGKRNSDVFGGEPLAGKTSNCSQVASLPRLHSRSVFQTEHRRKSRTG